MILKIVIDQVQFVRVVSGGGRLVTSNPGVQTLQIKGGQTFVNNVQGIRSVVPGNCKGMSGDLVRKDLCVVNQNFV